MTPGGRRGVAGIAVHENGAGRKSRAVARGEIAEHNHRVAGIAEREQHVAAGMAGAPGDQKRKRILPCHSPYLPPAVAVPAPVAAGAAEVPWSVHAGHVAPCRRQVAN